MRIHPCLNFIVTTSACMLLGSSLLLTGALRRQVMTDPHAPAEYRADTVRNIEAWYKAFNVKSGQTLFLAPADGVCIW